jgi:hypothetical protein
MLYHISKIAGLKILKPQVSTHKKAYVYAIENVVTGLLFGAPHDDFDFIISEENGISQPRIKNDGLCFDISDKIVVDVNVAFFVIVHGIAFADLNFLNQAHQRGTV